MRGWPVPLLPEAGRRSYIGVRNFCEVVFAACVARTVSSRPMLVADGEPMLAMEFARALSLAMGKPLRFVRVPSFMLQTALVALGRRTDYRRLVGEFVLNTELAKIDLGWVPTFTCEDELCWSENEESRHG